MRVTDQRDARRVVRAHDGRIDIDVDQVFRDPGAATAQRFGTTQYPETYIVNASGRVLYRVQGGIDWNDTEFRKRIDQLLAAAS